MDNYRGTIFSDCLQVFLFLLFYIATCEFLVKIKNCSVLLIFELSDFTSEIFRRYDFGILKYCCFWIDILGSLAQTLEPVPLCLAIEWPPGFLTIIKLYIATMAKHYNSPDMTQ